MHSNIDVICKWKHTMHSFILVNLRSIERQETRAINMYFIARDILSFPKMKHIEEVAARPMAAFRFKDYNETASTSPANCSKNFSFGSSLSRVSSRENIRYTRIKELWGRMKSRRESEVQHSSSPPITFVVESTPSGRTFRFSRSSLLTKSTAGNHGLLYYSTRRKSEIEFRDYYLVIPFSSVRRAWSPSGVRLRGSPRASWLRFSIRGSFAPGWLCFSRKRCLCKDLGEIVSSSAYDARSFFCRSIELEIQTHSFTCNFSVPLFKFIFIMQDNNYLSYFNLKNFKLIFNFKI